MRPLDLHRGLQSALQGHSLAGHRKAKLRELLLEAEKQGLSQLGFRISLTPQRACAMCTWVTVRRLAIENVVQTPLLSASTSQNFKPAPRQTRVYSRKTGRPPLESQRQSRGNREALGKLHCLAQRTSGLLQIRELDDETCKSIAALSRPIQAAAPHVASSGARPGSHSAPVSAPKANERLLSKRKSKARLEVGGGE